MSETRTCIRCAEAKTLDQFQTQRRPRKDGSVHVYREGFCRQCRKRAEQKVKKTCQHPDCGKEFWAPKTNKGHYCSKPCQLDAMHRARRGDHR